jgi:uncharacterized DUF497 family protein
VQGNEFERNDDKAAQNLRTHGISFDQARLVFGYIHAVELGEDQRGYGEQRFHVIGRAGAALLFVTYSERGERIRIISARPAERAERNFWLRENPPFG